MKEIIGSKVHNKYEISQYEKAVDTMSEFYRRSNSYKYHLFLSGFITLLYLVAAIVFFIIIFTPGKLSPTESSIAITVNQSAISYSGSQIIINVDIEDIPSDISVINIKPD